MAAVASGHFSHAPGLQRLEGMAEHRPSFTAVNGAPATSPKPVHMGENPPEAQDRPHVPGPEQQARPPQPPASAATAGEASPASGDEKHRDAARPERRMSPAPPPASAPTPGSALASIIHPTNSPSPTERLHPPSQRYSAASHQGSPRPTAAEAVDKTVAAHASSAAITSPQKRKRSLSLERQSSRNPSYSQAPPQPQSPNTSRMPNELDTTTEAEPYSPRQTYPPPQPIYAPTQGEPYHPPPNAHSYPPPPEPIDTQSEAYPRHNGTGRPSFDQTSPSQERPYYSESHLAEALERENRSYEPESRRESYAMPDDSDERPQPFATYGGSREAGTADLDRKRRKRVFSNRTKTGCMTCRRRKKKCDETHPECNNCLRGGFVCEGYTIRNTWQKPANTKQPIPLQSKNGFPPQESTPSRAPYPPMNRYPDNAMDYTPRSSISAPTPSYEQKQGSISEHESVYGRNSPPSDKGQPSSAWPKSQGSRAYPSNPPAASKYQAGEHRGSIYEIGSEREDGAPMPPPPVARTGSAQSQYSQPGHPPNSNSTPPNTNAQAAAQAALTHTSRSSGSRGQYTEREKMLKGMYYYPNTPALTEDRERCIAAIWRFNNATNPSHGASPEERTRLFRQILSLKPTPEPPLSNGEAPPMMLPVPTGSCGERVVVEAPFHCDYGYNITIGDDVLIGADCRISDTCSVTIGARCILSPNVKLICATYPIDPRRRMGSNGPALGRNIVIEEDCWIGAGVTILAGVRVGKSSTVGAGSLLHQDVPRFTVVAGNPAKVSRGIYDGSGDSQ